jgi:hypothetical protein
VSVDNLFKAFVLTEAVLNLFPVKTSVLDKVFGNKKFLVSGVFQWDIKSGSRRILKNLKVSDAATIRDGMGLKTVTCNGTRFAEKRFIGAADLDKLRGFGSQFADGLVGKRIADELTDIKTEIDRTREFMAIKAISGTVVDDNGDTLVDYGFSVDQKPTLTGKQKWTDSESNPIKNLRAWKKQITKAVGSVDKFYGFCGSEAMDALIENGAVQKLLHYSSGKQIADEGRIAFLAGVEIEEVLGTYVDKDGAEQDLIGAKEFILVGVSAQTASEIYVPVVNLNDPNGVGQGNPASMFFADSQDQWDPSGKWVRVESRPLPVLNKPQAVVKATVV